VRAAALAPVTAALFVESNPVPVKYALEAMGWMTADVRLPLCPASHKTRTTVGKALSEFGLLKVPEPGRVAG
jgi:4-hydroxy-tetrahydrodipicolinate synthase